jgi:hypothetical protein
MTVRRTAAILGVLAVALGIGLGPATSAQAAGADDAAAALKSANLYVAADIGDVSVSQANATAALAGTSVKVAVLAPNAGDPVALAKQIGQQLGNVTVGVFTGTRYGAGSGVLGKNCAAIAMSRAVQENLDQLKSTRDLTATIQRFGRLASTAPTSGQCSSGGSTSGGDTSKSNSSNGWLVLGGLGVVGAGAVGALVWQRRRKDRLALADARAMIQPYYDRLAAEVGSLQPMDNATAKQALADASERFNSGGSQLATAKSVVQLGGARRSILEGLQAIRTAREALGLDLGPELPPIAETAAPQLSEAQQVAVGGQTVQGYPAYTPGAPYYFAGGGGYAGGWYSMPFWQTLLIAEALSPGWGWGFGGGYGYGGGYGSGFDSGYDSGYQSGVDAGQNSGAANSGGDWGSGNDWSTSGGDWGGGGGGGDWGGGGGGGDWGGGGGGGDW